MSKPEIDAKVITEAKAAWENDPASRKFRDILTKNNIADAAEADGMTTHERLEMEWIIEQRQASKRGAR
jgi:hypothetical protein